jgi:hypothetical protein
MAKECKVKFNDKAYAIGDPPTQKISGVIANKGEIRNGATQYTIFKPSGISAICFRGGYCYTPAKAVKLLDCSVDYSGTKEEDSYSTIYYFK